VAPEDFGDVLSKMERSFYKNRIMKVWALIDGPPHPLLKVKMSW